ncbi:MULTISPECIES: hypothetical protein [Halomonadaceae]|uniref:hypothetical protein n=1 Tax=Halomonadaceae TaxID=28256 RepID=UPI00109FDD01|nr:MULTISPECIES: hypothetical protein [Halomonas]
MPLHNLLPVLTLVLHTLGLVTCLIGLTIARTPQRKRLGQVLAVLGFLIAASPMLAQLLGIIPPPPVTPIVPD